MQINIFLLSLSNWIKENITKKVTASILYKIPCFPKPLTGENILYLNRIKRKKVYKIIFKEYFFFNILIRSIDEIKRPVTAIGSVSAKYPTENLI